MGREASDRHEPSGDERAPLVTFLGPEGTFTHEAARAVWGSPARHRPLSTIPAVVASVVDRTAAFGVVPVENTVEGIITASVDQLVFQTAELVIVRETSVPITFTAYRSTNSSGPPQVVGSHPHGLAQCGRYVRGLGLPVENFPSTAAAVRAAAERPELIAIGRPGLEAEYRVMVVDSRVEDHHGAYTRFACLSRSDAPGLPAQNDPDLSWKTTMALTPLRSRPGVLADLCLHFADRDIDIISLSSRPLPGFAGRYVFVVTVNHPLGSPAMVRAVTSLLYDGIRIKFLGCYQSDHLNAEANPSQRLTPPIGSVGLADVGQLIGARDSGSSRSAP